jgi:hypothetical protein
MRRRVMTAGEIAAPSTELFAVTREGFEIGVLACPSAKAQAPVPMDDNAQFAAALAASHIPLPRLKQNTEPACE